MHRTLILDPQERRALETLRDHAPKPYLREKAAALIKVANGEIAAHVARTGLLRPRAPETIYRWLTRYQADGIAGLLVRPGRGRKPAFPPSGAGHPSRAASRDRIAAARSA
jgi:hypothetical protein